MFPLSFLVRRGDGCADENGLNIQNKFRRRFPIFLMDIFAPNLASPSLIRDLVLTNEVCRPARNQMAPIQVMDSQMIQKSSPVHPVVPHHPSTPFHIRRGTEANCEMKSLKWRRLSPPPQSRYVPFPKSGELTEFKVAA